MSNKNEILKICGDVYKYINSEKVDFTTYDIKEIETLMQDKNKDIQKVLELAKKLIKDGYKND